MAAWIHAVLHKLEGDTANSRYRYQRADRMDHVADEPSGIIHQQLLHLTRLR